MTTKTIYKTIYELADHAGSSENNFDKTVNKAHEEGWWISENVTYLFGQEGNLYGIVLIWKNERVEQ